MALRDTSRYSSPVYRSLDDTINKTTFELYVRESYRPVIHGYYLEHPEIPMLNQVSPMEENNVCYTRLPIINIVDLVVNGHEFSFKHGKEDIPKVINYLEAYIKQYEAVNNGTNMDKDITAFVNDAKHTVKVLSRKNKDIGDRSPKPKKKLSLIDKLKLFGPGIF